MRPQASPTPATFSRAVSGAGIGRRCIQGALMVMLAGLAACSSLSEIPRSDDLRLALIVDKADDDGSAGTLRWAIVTSNAEAGRYRIVLVPSRWQTLVIKPLSPLPALVGPARIEGPWKGEGEPSVVLDGSAFVDLRPMAGPGMPSACPGETGGFGPNVRSLKNAGLAVIDTNQVELRGFEVRNFCTGVMVLRSGHNRIADMRFYNNLGAAGVLLTGDAGDAKGSPTAGLNVGNVIEHSVFLNNSDAIDLARGETQALVRDNLIEIDARGIPSSGIEITQASGNTVQGNVVRGFAEALQIGGDGHVIADNTLEGNAVAMTVAGAHNQVTGNLVRGNRAGIATRGGANTLSRNLVYDNGREMAVCAPGGSAGGVCEAHPDWATSRLSIGLNRLAAPVADDGATACADGIADCDARQNAPVVTQVTRAGAGYRVVGMLQTRPNEPVVIELFASRTSGPDGRGEAERYVGQADARTDARGRVAFDVTTNDIGFGQDSLTGAIFTATATRMSSGQTSALSLPVAAAASAR